MGAKVDLHMHSSASDGTDTPAELLERIREDGLECFALTDHDTFDGVREILKLNPEDVRFIPGIEFSCRYRDKWQCHVLGYGADPDNSFVKRAVNMAQEVRRNKFLARIGVLSMDHGIYFSKEEVDSLRSKSCPGKPHLADLLVEKGYVGSTREAYDKYLNGMDTGGIHLEPDPMIRAIRLAGGIPVWAHPFGEKESSFTPGDVVEARVKILKQSGLRGLECYYSRYSKEQTQFLLDLADRYDLLVSGGSDYHGTRKKSVPGMLSKDGLEPSADQLTVLAAIKN